MDGLTNDQPLFLRTFAIFKVGVGVDTIYGQVVTFDGDLNFWTSRADVGGGGRRNGVGFAIGNKGYIGTGVVTDLGVVQDFWEFDPQTNIWTQRADVPGGTRTSAVGFSIGDKGFVGTGIGN